ncbi:phenylacetic acid degradation bifunctional protein PaaZ [Rosenbergiella collisarenosi]|uniref:phenylacetic acid degradation bifunctional protein PaaZ n=1 Tax=Rosenbergiella collisarenosi TaxID=1544695 RepID=UPI001BDB6544|nr:phenylacetic acid degradation bifunctional protein PaaZ [Rosenbergiella collisarenosi]MBT0721787.1 phenylacetic acid degradation bifunctional protein PaaZ [Rosenbergiella collisarenosi]
MQKLSSFVCNQWQTGQGEGRVIRHAITDEALWEVSSEGIDFAAAGHYAKTVGAPALQAMTFIERAALLKAVAKHLLAEKAAFYEISSQTGATRADSWVDIEGGIGTLFTYASLGNRELPDDTLWPEDPLIALSKEGGFAARHVLTSKQGVAVHINAFNFPCWGMLEKLAPTWLAGMPAIIKPGTATAQVTQVMVKSMVGSGLVPDGAISLICGSAGDLLDQLDSQDVVTFTGSAKTGQQLRVHPNLVKQSIPFTMEADSLNCCVLGESVDPEAPEFGLFIREIVREMSAKAGQKCTAIRRILVPEAQLDAVRRALLEKLSTLTVGDPRQAGVKMGTLVNRAQQQDVQQQVDALCQAGCERLLGGRIDPQLPGAGYPLTLLYCPQPDSTAAVHAIEAFGPVATLMAYRDKAHAITLARAGGGSLVATFVTNDDHAARDFITGAACAHGRIQILNRESAAESTGHGSPLPQLVHGGPGRAGGGEELGGLRAVKHYLQRTAIQGSPSMLATVGQQWVRGAKVQEEAIHPFRKYFEDLRPGDSLLTHRRTLTEADIVNFACLSGDHFYAHMDKIGAEASFFGERVVHGYFIVAAAAGLFVDAGVGPVIANYGLEGLRFLQPVKPGDTIQARLTCQQKTVKRQRSAEERATGVVQWAVDVTNQHQEVVAVYSILTLVARREADFPTDITVE